MHVIVLGCSAIGVEVALTLEQAGHTVAVVDADAAALARLGAAFLGSRIPGPGFDRQVLAQAGIERAQGLAALTDSDRTNVLAAHVARTTFKTPFVVAQLVDRRYRETYEHLGIPTVAPGAWGAQRVRELLAPPAAEAALRIGNGEVSVMAATVPAHAAGRAAGEIVRPGEIALVALVREGRAMVPAAGTRFEAGDVLYLSVAAGAQGRLDEIFDAGEGHS